MQKSYFSWIRNPMTIIALFVGLTEIGFGLSFSVFPVVLQEKFVWFLILFPSFCAVGFFVVLFFKPQNFYGPSDYSKDEHFLAVNANLFNTNEFLLEGKSKGKPRIKYSFLENLPIKAKWYLIKIANKPLIYSEHQFTLMQDLKNPIDALPDDIISNLSNNSHAIGYLHLLWDILLHNGIKFKKGSEEKIIIEIPETQLRLLLKSVAG